MGVAPKRSWELQYVGHCHSHRKRVHCGKYWSWSELAVPMGLPCMNEQAGPRLVLGRSEGTNRTLSKDLGRHRKYVWLVASSW